MKPIKSIIVIGGGTAGWLAASYLQRTMGSNPENPVSIKLIESPDIGVIGVGEATFPTLRNTMNALGIPESIFMAETEATLKNGIRYVGWRHGGPSQSDRYDHPFETPVAMDGYSTMVHWMNLKQRGLIEGQYSDRGIVQGGLIAEKRSPKLMHSKSYEGPIPYAYHLNAEKLGALLRQISLDRGVCHIQGKVEKVSVNEDGIKEVTLSDGTSHSADFFVDCSGFSSILIGKALDVPWVPFNDELLCDRAVACPAKHDSTDSELRSYTTSTAQKSGWIWDIDLSSRRGTGYVYSSEHCGEDEAATTLMQYFKDCNVAPSAEPRFLKMRIGHYARAWEKNCLALGLASGFIEPLESTSIYLIEHALQLFVDHWPTANSNGATREKFNRIMADSYCELRDFILLHYVLSRRKDSDFWRFFTESGVMTESLKRNLDLWDEKLPTNTDIPNRVTMFGPHNYFYILAGLNYLPKHGIGHAAYIPSSISQSVIEKIDSIRKSAIEQSPTMSEFMKKMNSAVENRPLDAKY